MIKSVLAVFGAALTIAALVCGCSPQDDHDLVSKATAMMRQQVASDVSLEVANDQFLKDPGGTFYYVCGHALVNQPGLVDHREERYIITVNRTMNRGVAHFDGSDSADGKATFAEHWEKSCPANAH
jgi:hypothetical protein